MSALSPTATSQTSDRRSMPRLAFGSWAFAFGPFESAPWSFERVCRYVAEAGYQGIEINGFRPHPHDEDHRTTESCAPLRDLLDELGLEISGYAPDFRTTPPADSPIDSYLDRVESTLDFCSRMGIGTLRTDAISPPGPMDAERFERLALAWRSAATRASDRGVLLVWEFEPGFWLNRPSQVLELVDKVDHENFRILFDTSHAYTGGVMGARQGSDPELLTGGVVDYAHLLGERIGHLHLIDSDGSLHDDETSSHIPFGQGNIDFDAVIAALPGQGLDLDWWTVDFCFCPTTENDGRQAVPFVRELLENALNRKGSAI